MWKKQRQFSKFSPARLIVTYYLVAIIISVILLSLPFVYVDGVHVSFIDTLFTAVSAVSVTGLTVINLSEVYTVAGIIILLFILQLGGFGVMSLGTFFWLLLGRRVGLKSRKLIMADQNQMNLRGVVSLVKDIFKIIILLQLAGALILGLYLLNYYSSPIESFYHGLFIAISATTNAGFDITGKSLMEYNGDYFIQIVTIVLVTLGAIGFPVLIEIKNFFKARREQNRFRFSLFTKLTTVTFGWLLVFGTTAIFLLEYNNFFANISFDKAFFYSVFQSASTRSAGLATLDVVNLTEPTLLVMGGLMFIGASPSSVGGGIRTTTFAVIILFIYHFSKGRHSIKVFGREIYKEDIFKAFTVLFLAVTLCFIAIVVLSITEGFTLTEIIFEVCSAFGTVGFSLGITPQLSVIGKIVIMIIMFIGRVGLLSFLFMLGGTNKEVPVNYPKERVIIG